MGSSTTDTSLEELLAPVVAASGLELDSVTRTRSDAMPLLRVIVDAPIGGDGVDSDTLADVSRAVSKALDAADPIDGEYLLEVSTPGAERELTKVGHWLRQVGRLVRIKLRAGGYVSGRVVSADETGAVIDVDGEETAVDAFQTPFIPLNMPPQLLHGNLIRHRPHLQMASRYRHRLPQETPTQSRPPIMRIRQWRWNVDSDLTATNKSSPLSHHRVASQESARFMIGRIHSSQTALSSE